MKKIKGLFFLILILCFVTGCTTEKKNKGENLMKGIVHIEMTLKNYGVVELELNADKAPITVTNFVKLVNDKFYDGLTFHRIAKDFVIQGGDPEGTGIGGSGETIQGEFKANGIQNDISHKRGVISMARGGNDYNSASSQFFIVLKDSTFLDGDYAAFGHVTKGMEIIDKIVKETKISSDGESVKKEDQPIIEKIRVKKENENKS